MNLTLICALWLCKASAAQGSAQFLIRDERTHHVLSGVQVRFPDQEKSWVTDREGIARCSPLSPGKHSYEIRAILNNIAYYQRSGTLLIRENKTTEISIFLKPIAERLICDFGVPLPKDWGGIRFQVVDALTGLPLEETIVLLSPSETDGQTQQITSEDTKACKSGTYCYAVLASVEGAFYERQKGEATVVPGKATVVNVRLRPRNSAAK